MELLKNLKEKNHDFLLDHPILKMIIVYGGTILGTVVSAFLLAYSFRALVHPTAYVSVFDSDAGVTVTHQYNLIAGGVSGLAQTIILAMEKFGVDLVVSEATMQSILYFSINVPLFILAFFCIGKRFAILSCINIILTSVFISVIPDAWTTIFSIQNDLIARAIFAGVMNGLSISIAVELNHSTGGTDIISMYFGLKKGISIGKYVLIINGSIVLLYTLLASINTPYKPSVPGAATMALYTLIFFFTSSVVIDHLSTRNKKVQLQIVTSEPRLAKVLIQNFPHGCTILDGKGAFLDREKKVILTVISSFELKRATEIIYKVDANAFITVSTPYKVLGKFFIRPMK